MSSLAELKAFVTKSFDDQQLSRGESKVFKQLLSEAKLDDRERDLLRHHLFDVAAEKLRHPQARTIIDWLSDLTRLMDGGGASRVVREETLFFPGDDAYRQFLAVLKSAHTSMDVCVFTITDNRVADILVDAHKAGVQVRIVSDNDKAHDLGADTLSLARAGLAVRFDDNPEHMHHKFAILDGHLLLSGSYNWTRSAYLKNHENLMITNAPGLVRGYQKEFDKLWALYEPKS